MRLWFAKAKFSLKIPRKILFLISHETSNPRLIVFILISITVIKDILVLKYPPSIVYSINFHHICFPYLYFGFVICFSFFIFIFIYYFGYVLYELPQHKIGKSFCPFFLKNMLAIRQHNYLLACVFHTPNNTFMYCTYAFMHLNIAPVCNFMFDWTQSSVIQTWKLIHHNIHIFIIWGMYFYGYILQFTAVFKNNYNNWNIFCGCIINYWIQIFNFFLKCMNIF